jgi:hypothetical protein
MNDCFIIGLSFLLFGVLALLSSLTKTGRNLDRAYLKSLPRFLRIKWLERLRNPIAIAVGALLSLVGTIGLLVGVYAWWSEVSCV